MPSKIIGNEKCSHVGKDGNPDCNKLGRDSSKPMVSWNNTQRFPRKREYWQFIHNDGTRHNIGSYKDYELKKIKGHFFEEHIKNFRELTETYYSIAYGLHRMAEKIRSNWPLTESEQRDLNDGIKYWNTII